MSLYDRRATTELVKRNQFCFFLAAMLQYFKHNFCFGEPNHLRHCLYNYNAFEMKVMNMLDQLIRAALAECAQRRKCPPVQNAPPMTAWKQKDKGRYENGSSN